jgi:hypothetical protein
MHRALQRIQYLREALRDGGLEYHRNYWMSPGYVVTRSVYALEKLRRQKLLEVADKEARLERDAKVCEIPLRQQSTFILRSWNILQLSSIYFHPENAFFMFYKLSEKPENTSTSVEFHNDRSMDWLIDWLIDRVILSLRPVVDWLIDWLVVKLSGKQINQSIG